MRILASILLIAVMATDFPSAVCGAEDRAGGLSRLISADVGLILEIPRAQQELSRISASPLLGRICGSSIFNDWKNGPDYRKLNKIRGTVEKLTGKPFRETVGELLGRDVVVALFPRAGGKIDFVFLTRATDSATLSKAVEIWDHASKHRLSKISYRGHSVRARVEPTAAGKKIVPLYWVQLDAIFALSGTKSEIQRVIDLHMTHMELRSNESTKQSAVVEKPRSITDEEIYARFRGNASEKNIATLFVSPRRWDPLFTGVAQTDACAKTLRAAWRQIESIGWEVQFSDAAEISTTIRYRTPEQSAGWQHYLDRLRGPTEFLQHIPQDALLAVAGRHDLAGGMSALMAHVLDNKQREEWEKFRRITRGLLLGQDLFSDVLPTLGPNYGGYVIATPQAKSGEFPICFVGAVELPQPEAAVANQPPLRKSIDNAVNTWMNYLAALHNSRHPRTPVLIETSEETNVTLRWISGLKKIQPAYAMTNGHLLISSMQRTVDGFVELQPADSLGAQPHFAAVAKDYFSKSDQVLYLNLVQMRKFLQEQRATVAAKIARAHSLSPQQAEQRLDRLNDLLRIFDAAFFTVTTRRDSIRVTLGGTHFAALRQ